MIKKKKQEEGRRKEKIKVWKNQTINPFFFLMNLGLKEPYLVYWWCLVVLDYIWSWLGLVLWLIWGCMETK